MVKISVFAFAATMVATAAASNCTPGLMYCGHTLYDTGDYDKQIKNALAAKNLEQSQHNRDESLYHCDGGDNGQISYQSTCAVSCKDAGWNKSDSC